LRKFISYIKASRINGAYLASQLYRPYKKVWLRDHAFITIALMIHRISVIEEIWWLKNLLQKETLKVRHILELGKNHKNFLDQDLHPRARYTPDFGTYNEPWSERQYDGIALAYGAILQFENRFGEQVLSEETKKLYDRYFLKVFDTPCADIWEMHDSFIHVETLGSIHYALKFRLDQLKEGTVQRADLSNFLSHLRTQIYGFEQDGVLYKMKKTLSSERPFGLDSSVLLLFTLFDVIHDPDIIQCTIAKLYHHLSPEGVGLRRFIIGSEKDTYFGGGVWYILNFWAAQCFMKMKQREKAVSALRYRFRFPLPEQINDDSLIFSQKAKEKWIQKSKRENGGIPGPADPLTWSNSEFIRVFSDIMI